MRTALPLLACLGLLAFAGFNRASFDSAGQPSLAKPEPAQANAPVPKTTELFVQGMVLGKMVWNVRLAGPVKWAILRNPPPAKKPVRLRLIPK